MPYILQRIRLQLIRISMRPRIEMNRQTKREGFMKSLHWPVRIIGRRAFGRCFPSAPIFSFRFSSFYYDHRTGRLPLHRCARLHSGTARSIARKGRGVMMRDILEKKRDRATKALVPCKANQNRPAVFIWKTVGQTHQISSGVPLRLHK